MKRKLTEDELKQRHTALMDHLNMQADSEIRLADVGKEIRKEIKYHKSMIDALRVEINSGEVEVDPQGKLI